MYRIENKSEAIKEIQSFLITIDDKSDVVPNGIYDNETKDAVEKFQIRWKLEPTGVVDYTTFTALNNEHKSKTKSKYAALNNSNLLTFPLAYGDYGNGVAVVNTMMQQFLERYSFYPRIKERKYFSNESVAAVLKIREILMLERGDTVTEEIYQRMKSDEYTASVFEGL